MKLRVPTCLLVWLATLVAGVAGWGMPPTPPTSQQIQLLLNRDNAAAGALSRQFLRRAQQQGAAAPLAEGYWLLGSALRDQGRFDSSLYYGQRTLSLATSQHLAEGQAQAYLLLAQTYKRLADAQHVVSLTRQGLAMSGRGIAAASQGASPVALSRLYIVRGIIYRDLNRFDSARVCYQRAIALVEQSPVLPSPLPIGYADIGQLLMDADHNLPAAIRYFRRTLPLYRREDNRNGLEHAYRNLSWAYRQQHRPLLAMQAADSCLALGRASGDPHRLENSLQTAYLAYRAAGQLPQAIALLEEWQQLANSLTKVNIARAVVASQATYELRQQASRINTLDLANTRQRRGLWAMGAGITLLLALLGLAAWQYRLIRRTVAQLHATNHTVQQRNERIAEQSERLATLLREVHHRVKNNLAIVAGLLRLQANRLTDPEAARAVQESQQRIEAMSLLHEGLYQTDDVTAVDMQRYLTDLVQSQSATYGLTATAFDVIVNVAPLRLEIDVAVPLGLLFNELLTNAFKYAIRQASEAKPVLRVSLQPDEAGNLLAEVQDNGPGFDLSAAQNSRSFGQRLIRALTEQLGGQLLVDVSAGTHYQLRFSPSRLV